MKYKSNLMYKGSPLILDANEQQLVFAHGLLKRLYRRMQMKGVRILQVARKTKSNSVTLYRAYTWEEACRLLEREMEVIECQIKKINQT